MSATRTFPPRPESVRAARRFAAEALTDVPAESFESIELMISELATNAVKHGGTAFALAITRDEETVRIEVTDEAGGTPTKRSPGPEEPTGRGLQIVEFLSDDWGVICDESSGKTVWLTVAVPPQAGATVST